MPNLFSTTYRQRALFVSGICLIGVITAVVLQHLLGWEPCPLCILQRLALVGLGLFALVAALTDRHSKTATSARLLASTAAAGGAYAAYTQLTMLWGPTQLSCGAGLRMFLLRMSEHLPALDWLLDGPADCASDANRVLGLPLAFWMLVLLTVCIVLLWLPRRKNAN